jgi:hypothetical protein
MLPSLYGEKICAHFRKSWVLFERLFGVYKDRERQNRIPRVGEGLATTGTAGMESLRPHAPARSPSRNHSVSTQNTLFV